jgi:hypothetical protein
MRSFFRLKSTRILVGSGPGLGGRKILLSRAAITTAAVLCALGCGSGSPTTTNPPDPGHAPAIVTQPANQSVPMGLAATFSVTTTGSGPLSYQWSDKGIPVSGATAATYTTPATTFADTGEGFTVTITNSLGSVTSNTATLTVTARAPQAGDLRFQQVDAASTVNGYTGDELSSLLAGNGLTFGNATGAPLSLGGSCSGGGDNPVFDLDCGWEAAAFNLPAGISGLLAGFLSDSVDDFQADLQGALGSRTYSTGALDSPDTVLTAIDMEPTYGGFATSWITTSQGGGFDLAQHTIPTTDLQQAAAQEGAQGRVITAISYDAGQILYLSYGWQSDPSTAYETQVATATFDSVGQVATSLAQAGYIITAAGGNYADGIVLVGTRVKGDSMARPIMVIPAGQSPLSLGQNGYAVVGFIIDSTGEPIWIGER